MDYKRAVMDLSNRMRLISLDQNSIYVQAKYGPSKIIRLPISIDEDLSCFSALIIGDGHLHKHKFRTTIECSNRELLDILAKIIFDLFKINVRISEVKKIEGKKQTWQLTIYSKAVQELLSIVFQVPRGKKSDIVQIPRNILSSNNQIKSAFVIGLLAAEGSRKGKYQVRICSASRNLLLDSQNMLKDLGIEGNIVSWINKTYKKEYYSLSFKRVHLDSLMRGCRSGQTGQILSIFKRVIEDQA